MKYVLIALIVIVVLAAWYFISTSNKFVVLQNKVEEAFATMDVYLAKRAELIPNLVATVKGYAKHETEALEKVIAARNNAHTTNEKIEAETQVTTAVRGLLALAEQYPDLKANTNFLNLQSQLGSIEEDVATARRYYNGVVRQYNTGIQTFPASVVANSKGLQKAALFEVADDSQRKAVKVEF